MDVLCVRECLGSNTNHIFLLDQVGKQDTGMLAIQY
jgi:hypothetical protein